MLAARGFGPSGSTGQATLQSGLNTASGIAGETGVAEGQQQNLNQSNLMAALNYAFTSLGSSGSTSSQQQGSQYGWNANAHVPFFGSS